MEMTVEGWIRDIEKEGLKYTEALYNTQEYRNNKNLGIAIQGYKRKQSLESERLRDECERKTLDIANQARRITLLTWVVGVLVVIILAVVGSQLIK